MDTHRAHDAYTWPYRFRFRIQYVLLQIMGPATLDADNDPRRVMMREHERRRLLHEHELQLHGRGHGRHALHPGT